MSTDSMGQWDVDEELVAEIEREGNRQIEIGYTERADDNTPLSYWGEDISRCFSKAVSDFVAYDMAAARRRLVQICALAIKALQAFDRRYPAVEPTAERFCRNCKHVPASERYARAYCIVGSDYIDRANMACKLWEE